MYAENDFYVAFETFIDSKKKTISESAFGQVPPYIRLPLPLMCQRQAKSLILFHSIIRFWGIDFLSVREILN